MPEDSPTWAMVAPALDFLESPTPYSPLILPGFDEFMNRPDENEDALVLVPGPVMTPGAETANLVEASEESFAEETGVGGGEDADRNSPS